MPVASAWIFLMGISVSDSSHSDTAFALKTSPKKGGSTYFTIHRTLGTAALGSFAAALAIGAASGNLSKLMDANHCCPDGGDRIQPWRTMDRILVDIGIVSYLGAGGMGLYSMGFRHTGRRHMRHKPHRWLALAHGAAFATSMATGIIMGMSQPSDPNRFASAARIHVTANVLLVPLLTLAYGNILFE